MRPIDADALIVEIERMMKHQIDADDICEMIQNFPTIEPERKKGKWKLLKDGSAICSECKFIHQCVWDIDNWDNFCRHCGADMR